MTREQVRWAFPPLQEPADFHRCDDAADPTDDWYLMLDSVSMSESLVLGWPTC